MSGRSASGNMRRWFRSSRTSQRAAIPIARCYAGTRSWSTSRSRHTFAAKTTHRSQTPRSLLRYSAMPRCCRFFVSPRREERAYPKRSLTDEQRRRDEKAAQPEGKTALGCLAALLGGGISTSLQMEHKQLCALISFAAGTLLGVTFFAILPEGLGAAPWWAVLLAVATGYALFFFISKHVHHVCPAFAAIHFDADATQHFSEIATALIVALLFTA